MGEKVAFETRQWDFVLKDGDFGKSGYHGQTLYISPSRDLVVVSFATGKGYDTWSFARAIAKSLQRDRVTLTEPAQADQNAAADAGRKRC